VRGDATVHGESAVKRNLRNASPGRLDNVVKSTTLVMTRPWVLTLGALSAIAACGRLRPLSPADGAAGGPASSDAGDASLDSRVSESIADTAAERPAGDAPPDATRDAPNLLIDAPATIPDAKDGPMASDAPTDVLSVASDADPIILDAGSARPTFAGLAEAAGFIGCSGSLPYAGPLCQGTDCVVLGRSVPVTGVSDIALDPVALSLGDDCRPHVSYTYLNGNDIIGRYLTLDGGLWRSEDIGPNDYPLGIVVDPTTQVPTLVVDMVSTVDQVTTATYALWRREASGWTNLGAIDGTYMIWGDFVPDPMGTLHVLRQATDHLHSEYGTYDGSKWTFKALGDFGEFYSNAQLAFSASGVPQFTYAPDTLDGHQGLMWATLGGPLELIRANLPFDGANRLAVSDADPDLPTGTPHIIFDAGKADGLVYATRTKEGWISSAIRKATMAGDNTTVQATCPTPGSAGVTCDYDYDNVEPLAILATKDGQVRMLYLYNHYKGTAASICQFMMVRGLVCYFPIPDAAHDSELWMAWPSGHDQVSSVLLLQQFDVGSIVGDESFDVARGANLYYHPTQAAIDSLGRIHLVAAMHDGSLSYLVIGAGAAR
jgi:hypothetical protein